MRRWKPRAYEAFWACPFADVAVAHRFAETWGKLREYDAAHGSEYEQTLQAYLRNGGHYVRTADALKTHRHTVRKRIADAAEILEIDLDDSVAVAELDLTPVW